MTKFKKIEFESKKFGKKIKDFICRTNRLVYMCDGMCGFIVLCHGKWGK